MAGWRKRLAEAQRQYDANPTRTTRAEYRRVLAIFTDLVCRDKLPPGVYQELDRSCVRALNDVLCEAYLTISCGELTESRVRRCEALVGTALALSEDLLAQ